MSKIKLLLLVVLSVLANGGCISADTRSTLHAPVSIEDLLVKAVLSAAEQQHRVSTILIGPEVSEGIAREAARLRPTRRVRSSEIEGLLKGQLLLQGESTGPNLASLSGRLGPVPRPQPGVMLLSCGTGLTVVFERVGTEWQQRELQTLDC